MVRIDVSGGISAAKTSIQEGMNALSQKAQDWIQEFPLTRISQLPSRLRHSVSTFPEFVQSSMGKTSAKTNSQVNPKQETEKTKDPEFVQSSVGKTSAKTNSQVNPKQWTEKTKEFNLSLIRQISPDAHGAFRLGENENEAAERVPTEHAGKLTTHEASTTLKKSLKRRPLLNPGEAMEKTNRFINEEGKFVGKPEETYKALTSSLSDEKRVVFDALIRKFAEVDAKNDFNDMPASNIAISIGPSLFPEGSVVGMTMEEGINFARRNTQRQIEIVQSLVDYTKQLKESGPVQSETSIPTEPIDWSDTIFNIEMYQKHLQKNFQEAITRVMKEENVPIEFDNFQDAFEWLQGIEDNEEIPPETRQRVQARLTQEVGQIVEWYKNGVEVEIPEDLEDQALIAFKDVASKYLSHLSEKFESIDDVKEWLANTPSELAYDEKFPLHPNGKWKKVAIQKEFLEKLDLLKQGLPLGLPADPIPGEQEKVAKTKKSVQFPKEGNPIGVTYEVPLEGEKRKPAPNDNQPHDRVWLTSDEFRSLEENPFKSNGIEQPHAVQSEGPLPTEGGKVFSDRELKERLSQLETSEGKPLKEIAPEKVYEALTNRLSPERKAQFDQALIALRDEAQNREVEGKRPYEDMRAIDQRLPSMDLVVQLLSISSILETPLGLSGGSVETFDTNKTIISKLLKT